jgi:hypothetical protein
MTLGILPAWMFQLSISLDQVGATQADASDALLFLFKTLFLIGGGLYVIFAFIVIRQVDIMRKTLITEFSSIFTTLAYLHFGLSLAVIALYLAIL